MEKGLGGYTGGENELPKAPASTRENPWRRLFMQEVRPEERLHDDEDKEEEDDDSESTPTSKKSRRLRRLLKSLFQGPEKDKQPNPVETHQWRLPLLSLDKDQLDPESTSSRFLQEAGTVAPDRVHEAFDSTLSAGVEPGLPLPAAKNRADMPPTPIMPPRSVLEQGSYNGGEPDYIGRGDRMSQPAAPEQSPETSRWGQLAALGVLAETIGRRRADSNIRRDIKNQTTRFHQEVSQTRSTEQRLETEQRATNTRLEALQRQSFEQAAARVFEQRRSPAVPEVNVPAGRQELAPTPMHRQEAVVSRPEQALPVFIPETEKFAEAHVRPRVVMEQIATAAEQDTPVERAYERRQEVKDEPSRSGGASSVGAVLAGTSGAYNLPPDVNASSRPTQSSSSGFNSPPEPSAYKSAAIQGFGAALALLTLGFIAYLIVR